LSIREALGEYFVNPDERTDSSNYSAEELATVAEDILGKEEYLSRMGGTALGVYKKEKFYNTVEDLGVEVNSIREEPYKALETAAELLKNNKVEVWKER